MMTLNKRSSIPIPLKANLSQIWRLCQSKPVWQRGEEQRKEPWIFLKTKWQMETMRFWKDLSTPHCQSVS